LKDNYTQKSPKEFKTGKKGSTEFIYTTLLNFIDSINKSSLDTKDIKKKAKPKITKPATKRTINSLGILLKESIESTD